MFHRRYSNCRPQNSAPYNRIIFQTVENTSFLLRLSYILYAFANGYQGYESNFGKSRIKNPFLESPKGIHPYFQKKGIFTDYADHAGTVSGKPSLTVIYLASVFILSDLDQFQHNFT